MGFGIGGISSDGSPQACLRLLELTPCNQVFCSVGLTGRLGADCKYKGQQESRACKRKADPDSAEYVYLDNGRNPTLLLPSRKRYHKAYHRRHHGTSP
jgi:hypothetical protein